MTRPTSSGAFAEPSPGAYPGAETQEQVRAMHDYIEQASEDQEEPYYAGDNRFGTQYEDEDQGDYPPEYYYEQEEYGQQYEYD